MYNYPRFNSCSFDLTEFKGPKAGEQAPDFEAVTLDGKPIHLSDFFGKPIVLESGSFTCPMFVKNIEALNNLAQKYSEIQFLVLYVREAHPGVKVPSHSSLAEKINLAKRLQNEENEKRQILVDNLEGTAHLQYGDFPNVAYLIDSDGTILVRLDWSQASVIEEKLRNFETKEIDLKDHIEFEKPTASTSLRVLLRAGWGAVWDLLISLPHLLLMHLKANKKAKKGVGS